MVRMLYVALCMILVSSSGYCRDFFDADGKTYRKSIFGIRDYLGDIKQKNPSRHQKLYNSMVSLEDRASIKKRRGDKVLLTGLIAGGAVTLFGIYRMIPTNDDLSSPSFGDRKYSDGPLFIGMGVGIGLISWLIKANVSSEDCLVEDYLKENRLGISTIRVDPSLFKVANRAVPGIRLTFNL